MSRAVATKRLASSAIGAGAVAQHDRSPFWHVPAYLVRRLQLICTAVVAEAVEGENLSMLQWVMLAHIDEMPDIDQSRLAELVSIDKTNTGRLIDQLELMGLVERRANSADRRAWMLHLTARGQGLRRRLNPKAQASQERLLSCLAAKERETFFGLLHKIILANEDYIRPGAGRRKPTTNPRNASNS
jgi:DNA-binding MarR family transcriptional regulator